MQALYPLLLLTYPVILHVGVYSGNVTLATYYLSFLLLLPVLVSIFKRAMPGFFAIIAFIVAMILLFFSREYGEQLLKLVPLFINSVLLWMFASTLVTGRTPLVTQLASLMREDMPQAVKMYTRKATIAWAIYFILMLLTSMMFAVFASLELWSFFNNILSYVLLALMFLVEFVVRKRVLGKHIDYSFTEFILRMKKVNFSAVLKK